MQHAAGNVAAAVLLTGGADRRGEETSRRRQALRRTDRPRRARAAHDLQVQPDKQQQQHPVPLTAFPRHPRVTLGCGTPRRLVVVLLCCAATHDVVLVWAAAALPSSSRWMHCKVISAWCYATSSLRRWYGCGHCRIRRHSHRAAWYRFEAPRICSCCMSSEYVSCRFRSE